MSSNGYSAFELEVVQRLTKIESGIAEVRSAQAKNAELMREHDSRIKSLEDSRTWVNGSLYTLWLIFGSAIAFAWKKIFG